MFPGLSSLSNSGSMPINAGGGSAGPSGASSHNTIGGARNGNVTFGQTPWKTLAVAGVTGLFIWWVMRK